MDVSALPSTPSADTVHGGRLLAAAEAFPHAPTPWIDLSTGISPFGYPIAGIETERFTRLPEPEQEAQLRAIAADAYGAPDAGHVALAPGSQMLISLLPLLLRCRRAVVLSPGYAEHEAAWARAGASVLRAASVAALVQQAGPDTVLVLSNPNNPDGRRTEAGVIAELADRCADGGGWLVVDEAYADLEPAVPRAARLLASNNRLLVLRSFGKSYGLAGLRLGFLLGSPEIVRKMVAMLGPWPVSGPALAVGSRALADRAWLAEATGRAAQASGRLDRLLCDNRLRDGGGTALFRLVHTEDADRVWHALAAAGILVRRFQNDAGALRFGLPGNEAAWDRLSACLHSVCAA